MPAIYNPLEMPLAADSQTQPILSARDAKPGAKVVNQPV